ncbi:MAG TPA: hypothetical protein PKB01_10770 [Xanthobacteraceae bacterium]|nr:hypothetical protein [Xanthobacteraceae bacterium]
MNRRAFIAGAALAALACAFPASAQTWKTYPRVAVSVPAAPGDISLGVFRERLLDIAKNKDKATLEKILARDFFWERDFGGSFEKGKAPIVHLDRALGLSTEDGGGWRFLIAFAQATPGPHGKRANVLCSPPAPRYSDKAFENLLKVTNSDVFDWSYPAKEGVTVREKSEAGAPEIAKLTPHFVFTDLAGRTQDFNAEKDWTAVILPDGKRGFVAPGELLTPLDPRLCFLKRGGKWFIAGYIGGGD